MRRFQTRVPGSIQKARLDQFLLEWLSQSLSRDLSKSVIRTLIATGAVYVNRHRCQNPSTPLFSGATLEVFYDENRLNEPKRYLAVTLGSDQILYEDSWIIAVNKPPGLPTQTTIDPNRPNLYTALKGFLNRREKTEDAYVGLHHRLDRDTSGVVLFTKHEDANKGVAELFSEHRIQKTYHCVPWRSPGSPDYHDGECFLVRNRLGKVGARNGKAIHGEVREGGDLAHTDFRVIERFRDAYWIEARPKTGRTHQIRAHLREVGLPIFGDELYFPEDVHPIHRAPRLLLHASKLEFLHPMTGQEVKIESNLPSEFVAFLSLFKS